jgi:hypothetical protein
MLGFGRPRRWHARRADPCPCSADVSRASGRARRWRGRSHAVFGQIWRMRTCVLYARGEAVFGHLVATTKRTGDGRNASSKDGAGGLIWGPSGPSYVCRLRECRALDDGKPGQHASATPEAGSIDSDRCACVERGASRRGGRVAEGGGLLNRYTVISRIGGSNPPPSARPLTGV